MTGDLENEAALDHPGNAVVKPLTGGFDPWETHELGGDADTTNSNSVTINHIELGIISTFRPVPPFRRTITPASIQLDQLNRSLVRSSEEPTSLAPLPPTATWRKAKTGRATHWRQLTWPTLETTAPSWTHATWLRYNEIHFQVRSERHVAKRPELLGSTNSQLYPTRVKSRRLFAAARRRTL
jgi:hypothetical protein